MSALDPDTRLQVTGNNPATLITLLSPTNGGGGGGGGGPLGRSVGGGVGDMGEKQPYSDIFSSQPQHFPTSFCCGYPTKLSPPSFSAQQLPGGEGGRSRPLTPPPPLRYSLPTLSAVRENICSILLSVIPYVLFLAVFAINPYLHVLLTVNDVIHGDDDVIKASCVTLYNVSAWESHVLPFSVHRLISSMNCTVLDVVSTVPYMMHYVIPVLFPLYLAVTDQWKYIPRFYRLLGVAMWAHYVIWYLLPTAPPWAYPTSSTPSAPSSLPLQLIANPLLGEAVDPSLHPLPLRIDLTHREGAAFARVDALTGLQFFYNMFAGNPVPFAAFPSGHVTWAMCILMNSPPGGRPRFVFYVLLVAWATLYTSHHYLFDALAGVSVVVVTHCTLAWLYGYSIDATPLSGATERTASNICRRRIGWTVLGMWRKLTNQTQLLLPLWNGAANHNNMNNNNNNNVKKRRDEDDDDVEQFLLSSTDDDQAMTS